MHILYEYVYQCITHVRAESEKSRLNSKKRYSVDRLTLNNEHKQEKEKKKHTVGVYRLPF